MDTGVGKSNFFGKMDPDKLPVLKWTALYPHTNYGHEMNSVALKQITIYRGHENGMEDT